MVLDRDQISQGIGPLFHEKSCPRTNSPQKSSPRTNFPGKFWSRARSIYFADQFSGDSTILGFAPDRLSVTVTLFYRRCLRFTPQGDCFRTENVGHCLPDRNKAFSRHGSRKKMLTWYAIVLQSLAHTTALLTVVLAV